MVDTNGHNMLHRAILNDHADIVEVLLQDEHMDVNKKVPIPNYGWQGHALHLAAERGNVKVLEAMPNSKRAYEVVLTLGCILLDRILLQHDYRIFYHTDQHQFHLQPHTQQHKHPNPTSYTKTQTISYPTPPHNNTIPEPPPYSWGITSRQHNRNMHMLNGNIKELLPTAIMPQTQLMNNIGF